MNKDQQIEKILERNKRVEQEKKWETSWTRRILLTFVTWILAFAFLYIIEAPNAALAAGVPAGGFFLSTLRLPFVYKIWKHFQR